MDTTTTKRAIGLAMALVAAQMLAPAGARAAAGESGSAAVAHVSMLTGNVVVQRGDAQQQQFAAALNAPILGADYVSTGEGARAEVQLDGTSRVRLGENVQMRFTRLDADAREMQLAQGTVELSLLRGAVGRPTIDTPSISIRPDEAGDYRVSVDTAGATTFTVRTGHAQIVTPQGDQPLAPGRTLVATGSAAEPVLAYQSALAFDDFDRFNADRDRAQRAALAAAPPSVNPYVDGYADLGDYGRWADVPSYGHVWVPAEPPGWAPYRDGRWVWEDGYGWTWVAYEPWGWAPYHYGRWYHDPGYGWAWYPPPVAVAPPVWEPALVGFIGFGGGGGFSLGFGFGNIGWVPLAPFEAYHPWYGYGGPRIVQNNVTNVTNVTNITNVTNASVTHTYRNTLAAGAITAVSARNFQDGNFEHRQMLSAGALKSVSLVRGPLPVVPTPANLRFSAQPVAHEIALNPALREARFAGTAAPAQRIPFEQQRASISSVIRPALRGVQAPQRSTAAAASAVRPATAAAVPAQRPAMGAAASQVRGSSDPWTRYSTARGVPVTAPRASAAGAGAPAQHASAASPATTLHTVPVLRGDAAPPPPRADAWSRYSANRGTTLTTAPAPASRASARTLGAPPTRTTTRTLGAPPAGAGRGAAPARRGSTQAARGATATARTTAQGAPRERAAAPPAVRAGAESGGARGR